jgi:ubiquinol-cytochrome c reductase cytochrome b subunit
MKSLISWLDHRTGVLALMHEALYERIPGGARWRYVWGSTLVFAFTVQAITGIFLWMAYSPGGQSAWESVYWIQHEVYGGWLLRGLHHYMAQAMVVLLVLHLMQVVIDGAYRAPREVNFWLGLILMKIVLGLSLTGYLLPWDQKGYWATRVATNLSGIVPVVGPAIQKLVVGGSDYGNYTLTRFFALHVGVLPALLVGFLVVHVALFRRHGLHAKLPSKKPDCYFWPDQVLKDAVACLAVLAVVLFFVFKPVILDREKISLPPGEYLGADLGAPADRANEYSAARPEWYFLFLFQFLKLFEGQGETGELLGAIVLPGAVMGLLFLMPILGKWKLGHRFNIGLLFCLMIGIAYLTGQAYWDDNQAKYVEEPAKPSTEAEKDEKSPEVRKYRKFKASQEYLKAVNEAEEQAHRAVVLAKAPPGIPTGGVVSLMRQDPKVEGPRLFKRYCASCHDHADSAGEGFQTETPTAPNLYNFADRNWITGLLDPNKIAGPAYFGNTKHKAGQMVDFVKEDITDPANEKVKNIVKALSAEAKLPAQHALDAKDATAIAAGQELIKSGRCAECHKFHDAGGIGSGGPDLTGYGSREWLTGMISNPTHERFYGAENDRMPAFADDIEHPDTNILRPENLRLLVDWLRGDWYEPAAKAE